jgi:predicted secreted protein
MDKQSEVEFLREIYREAMKQLGEANRQIHLFSVRLECTEKDAKQWREYAESIIEKVAASIDDSNQQTRGEG